MSADEGRRATLDPGLTLLALRSLHDRDGHHPFVERVVRHRWPRGRRARADDGQWLRPFLAFLERHRPARAGS